MDQQSKAIAKHADIGADLLYLAPMTERSHNYSFRRDRKGEIYLMHHKPKQRGYYAPKMPTDEAPADVLQRESIELRATSFHAA